MKRKSGMILLCVILCLLMACTQSDHEDTAVFDQGMDEIHVASNISAVDAFADQGYYHMGLHSVSYIDWQHQDDKKETVYSEDSDEALFYIMYHQEKLYVLSIGTDPYDASNIWRIKRWDADHKKKECVAEERGNGMVYSMAAVGDMLYYTFTTTEGEITVDGITYGYGKAQLWSVDLATGNKKLVLELEGSEKHFNNSLTITEGDYQNSSTLLVRYCYSVQDESNTRQDFTDFYDLDLQTQKMKKNERLQLSCSLDMAYWKQGALYYYAGNGNQTDYNYMNMETGEVKTVLTTDMFGLFLPEYISFAIAGDEPKHCLYYYEDGKLLISKSTSAPNIIAAGGNYAALDETDYSKIAGEEEDPGTYTMVENDKYVQKNYREYAGENPDILMYYGKDGNTDTILNTETNE